LDAVVSTVSQDERTEMTHFQVRTDNHLPNTEAQAERIRGEVEQVLSPKYIDRVQRAEVYLQDVNSDKKPGVDIRCAIELHLAGHQPIAVDSHAGDIDSAVTATLDKLASALEKRLGRIDDRGERISMSGQPT
jgi:ribosome-associated translation inhibitor RaiA